jgi:hypothetical protein
MHEDEHFRELRWSYATYADYPFFNQDENLSDYFTSIAPVIAGYCDRFPESHHAWAKCGTHLIKELQQHSDGSKNSTEFGNDTKSRFVRTV